MESCQGRYRSRIVVVYYDHLGAIYLFIYIYLCSSQLREFKGTSLFIMLCILQTPGSWNSVEVRWIV